MESNGCRELDWLVQLRARGAFGVDRHVCVVRRSGSRRSRNGRGRLDPRGLAAGRGRCDGDWHLVHALHRDAGVHPADSRGLPLANRSAVTDCGHCRVGHCAVRGEPTENGYVPCGRRKRPDGCGHCEYALHRHGRHAFTFHFRHEKKGIGWEKLAGAVVMGAAIPVMHYTGMASASFTSSDVPVDLSHAASISTLGTAGIAAVTFIVLGLALLTSGMDRRFAAQTSEAYLSEAQQLSHTGSFGWRVSTGEIIWSAETFRIFQCDRTTQPTVELVLQRVHPEDAALVRQTLDRARHDKKDFDLEHRLLMPDASVKHLRLMTRAMEDASGNVEFVGAVMDITERKRAEVAQQQMQRQLQQAAKMEAIGRLAGGIAHDFNNILGAILGYGELAQKNLEG